MLHKMNEITCILDAVVEAVSCVTKSFVYSACLVFLFLTSPLWVLPYKKWVKRNQVKTAYDKIEDLIKGVKSCKDALEGIQKDFEEIKDSENEQRLLEICLSELDEVAYNLYEVYYKEENVRGY